MPCHSALGTGIVPALGFHRSPGRAPRSQFSPAGLQQPPPSPPPPPMGKVSSSLQRGPPVPSQENPPEVRVLDSRSRRPVFPDLAVSVTPPNSSPGLTEGPMGTSGGPDSGPRTNSARTKSPLALCFQAVPGRDSWDTALPLRDLNLKGMP